MARTAYRVVQLFPSRTDQRPAYAPATGPRWSADLGDSHATQVDDDDCVAIFPWHYDAENDGRWRESSTCRHLWQATLVYEDLQRAGQSHPRIVPFIHRDPWTAWPVLSKPSGPELTKLLGDNVSRMYSAPLDSVSSRIQSDYFPLVCQWALHIVSALSFVHANDIVWGDLHLCHCWLSSSDNLSLSLAGFTTSGSRHGNGAWIYMEDFHPSHDHQDPTKETDIFLYGCVVYELMTGAWPGERPKRAHGEATVMMRCEQWPSLQAEYMGEIVRKCWTGGYMDVEQLKGDVFAFLEKANFVIEGDDNIQGLDYKNLLCELDAE